MPWQSCWDAGGSNGHAKVAINGYVGLKPLMQDTLGFNAFSEEGMIALLQRLVCKHLEFRQ
jgi:hypothetical protein